MNDSSTGPLIVGMLFIVRCLIPLGILFGISYLLQHFGLVESYGEVRGGDAPSKVKKQAQIAETPPVKKTHPKSTPKRKQTTKKKSVSKSKRSGKK
jgi:hypothetical protein